MKKVLSPISDTKTREKAAAQPAWRSLYRANHFSPVHGR